VNQDGFALLVVTVVSNGFGDGAAARIQMRCGAEPRWTVTFMVRSPR
jgi:hypothetical protein